MSIWEGQQKVSGSIFVSFILRY